MRMQAIVAHAQKNAKKRQNVMKLKVAVVRIEYWYQGLIIRHRVGG
eukprot:CAMPEP_0185761380 /NCGR_PEP_ID=MMETSP1174-20130828/20308_1 /TAXON_ID=35687 /ORGANISM="Dictyocha speculum, Strain CCMP1381" /LENGTH=45 /DNA_ID= /DNA_START= /DNA_END= /DNA_ORIENTATION=